jgi:hypothetical protein
MVLLTISFPRVLQEYNSLKFPRKCIGWALRSLIYELPGTVGPWEANRLTHAVKHVEKKEVRCIRCAALNDGCTGDALVRRYEVCVCV